GFGKYPVDQAAIPNPPLPVTALLATVTVPEPPALMSMPSAMPAGSAPWSAPRVLSAIVVFVTDSEAIGAGAGSPERVDVSSAPIPAPMPPGAGVTPERR